ncbi:serine/threonine-protein phosphatase 4 regulatory subunit 2-like [Dorcoceras hygrometricum]|uniref:Serine/threonine-protein phosphatase 4 regulatory subunit 2-like n=1 Tax=Dorcoceras hygrometricum TaxID=472368 RepID=A0A2Z7BKD0_9LAMI|nr:serine/threonine-protein phosphatase 4 regulatory subunit 2-like [Dorcoceras hygrometricum]
MRGEEESFERLEEATISNKTSSAQNRDDEQAGKLVKVKQAQIACQMLSNPRARRFEYNAIRKTLLCIQIDLLVLSSQNSAHSDFPKGKSGNISSDELTDCTRSVDAKISRAG